MATGDATPFLLLLTVLTVSAISRAQLLPIVEASHASVLETYIVYVEMGATNSTDLLSTEELDAWYLSFLPNTTLSSGEPRLLHSYRHVISGFAAKLTSNELKSIKSKPGFVSAHPEGTNVYPGTTYTPSFLELNSWKSVWQASNYGEGVIIGVVDSGIFPSHSSFSDGKMPRAPAKWRGCCEFTQTREKCRTAAAPSVCNNKLIGARSSSAFTTADDEVGHGTHCASTAAGSWVTPADVLGQAPGTAVGVAPLAHLASYKACLLFAGTLKCSDSHILDSIDKAIGDGVDVLSLSLGSPKERFYQSSVMKGTLAAAEKGIFSSACAGNFGIRPNDLENDAPWILTVGASSIDRSSRAVVSLGDGTEFIGESGYQPPGYGSPMLAIEFPGITQESSKLGCRKGSLDKLDVAGKIVLCAIGLGDVIEMSEVVKAAGGAAMVVMNSNWDGYTTLSEVHLLPSSHLNHNDSVDVIKYYNASILAGTAPVASIIFKGTQFNSRKAPAVASFSSRGPSLINGGILKPDIIGPGVNILAAWHKEVGPDPTGKVTSPFNFARGCSMATPHLAGVAALLKAAHDDWNPAMIKSAIMTTAHITDRDGDKITDEKSIPQGPASVFAMGAGHVNAPKANDPGLVYDTPVGDYVGYLCGLGYSDEQMFKTTRKRLQCSSVQKIKAEDLNYPSILVRMGHGDKKTVPRVLTNVVEKIVGEEEYVARVDEPHGADVHVQPHKLRFSRNMQQESFQVTIKRNQDSKGKGEFSEGYLTWESPKHSVRSPIVVEF